MNEDNPLLAMLMGGGAGGDPSGMGGPAGDESMPGELAMAGMPPDMGGGGEPMISVPVALFEELMAKAYPPEMQQIPAAAPAAPPAPPADTEEEAFE